MHHGRETTAGGNDVGDHVFTAAADACTVIQQFSHHCANHTLGSDRFDDAVAGFHAQTQL